MTPCDHLIKLDRPLLIFDVETTTPVPDNARIISLAYQRFVDWFPGPNGPDRQWQSLINPLMPIPPESTEIHGITDAMVQGCKTCGMERENPQHLPGCPDDAGAHDFQPWPTIQQLAPHLAKGFTGCDFGGFNVRFDLQVSRLEMLRSGVVWDYPNARILDGLRLWQILKPRTLSDAVEIFGYGAKVEGAHEADADVKSSIIVISGQLVMFAKLPRTIAELDALCFPGRIDSDGKFAFVHGVPTVNFGKHKGTPMRDVDAGYYRWMLGKDFAPSTKDAANNARLRIFPEEKRPFCQCTADAVCDFHKRGGYTTSADNVKEEENDDQGS
jgi:DNA polymerase-3 subunit epsilon